MRICFERSELYLFLVLSGWSLGLCSIAVLQVGYPQQFAVLHIAFVCAVVSARWFFAARKWLCLGLQGVSVPFSVHQPA